MFVISGSLKCGSKPLAPFTAGTSSCVYHPLRCPRQHCHHLQVSCNIRLLKRRTSSLASTGTSTSASTNDDREGDNTNGPATVRKLTRRQHGPKNIMGTNADAAALPSVGRSGAAADGPESERESGGEAAAAVDPAHTGAFRAGVPHPSLRDGRIEGRHSSVTRGRASAQTKSGVCDEPGRPGAGKGGRPLGPWGKAGPGIMSPQTRSQDTSHSATRSVGVAGRARMMTSDPLAEDDDRTCSQVHPVAGADAASGPSDVDEMAMVAAGEKGRAGGVAAGPLPGGRGAALTGVRTRVSRRHPAGDLPGATVTTTSSLTSAPGPTLTRTPTPQQTASGPASLPPQRPPPRPSPSLHQPSASSSADRPSVPVPVPNTSTTRASVSLKLRQSRAATDDSSKPTHPISPGNPGPSPGPSLGTNSTTQNPIAHDDADDVRHYSCVSLVVDGNSKDATAGRAPMVGRARSADAAAAAIATSRTDVASRSPGVTSGGSASAVQTQEGPRGLGAARVWNAVQAPLPSDMVTSEPAASEPAAPAASEPAAPAASTSASAPVTSAPAASAPAASTSASAPVTSAPSVLAPVTSASSVSAPVTSAPAMSAASASTTAPVRGVESGGDVAVNSYDGDDVSTRDNKNINSSSNARSSTTGETHMPRPQSSNLPVGHMHDEFAGLAAMMDFGEDYDTASSYRTPGTNSVRHASTAAVHPQPPGGSTVTADGFYHSHQHHHHHHDMALGSVWLDQSMSSASSGEDDDDGGGPRSTLPTNPPPPSSPPTTTATSPSSSSARMTSPSHSTDIPRLLPDTNLPTSTSGRPLNDNNAAPINTANDVQLYGTGSPLYVNIRTHTRTSKPSSILQKGLLKDENEDEMFGFDFNYVAPVTAQPPQQLLRAAADLAATMTTGPTGLPMAAVAQGLKMKGSLNPTRRPTASSPSAMLSSPSVSSSAAASREAEPAVMNRRSRGASDASTTAASDLTATVAAQNQHVMNAAVDGSLPTWTPPPPTSSAQGSSAALLAAPPQVDVSGESDAGTFLDSGGSGIRFRRRQDSSRTTPVAAGPLPAASAPSMNGVRTAGARQGAEDTAALTPLDADSAGTVAAAGVRTSVAAPAVGFRKVNRGWISSRPLQESAASNGRGSDAAVASYNDGTTATSGAAVARDVVAGAEALEAGGTKLQNAKGLQIEALPVRVSSSDVSGSYNGSSSNSSSSNSSNTSSGGRAIQAAGSSAVGFRRVPRGGSSSSGGSNNNVISSVSIDQLVGSSNSATVMSADTDGNGHTSGARSVSKINRDSNNDNNNSSRTARVVLKELLSPSFRSSSNYSQSPSSSSPLKTDDSDSSISNSSSATGRGMTVDNSRNRVLNGYTVGRDGAAGGGSATDDISNGIAGRVGNRGGYLTPPYGSSFKPPSPPGGWKPRGTPETTLFVKGLDPEVGEQGLREGLMQLFGSAGRIVQVRLPCDSRSGLKGIAYVVFQSAEEKARATALDGSELFGRVIRVDVNVGRPS